MAFCSTLFLYNVDEKKYPFPAGATVLYGVCMFPSCLRGYFLWLLFPPTSQTRAQ